MYALAVQRKFYIYMRKALYKRVKTLIQYACVAIIS